MVLECSVQNWQARLNLTEDFAITGPVVDCTDFKPGKLLTLMNIFNIFVVSSSSNPTGGKGDFHGRPLPWVSLQVQWGG